MEHGSTQLYLSKLKIILMGLDGIELHLNLFVYGPVPI